VRLGDKRLNAVAQASEAGRPKCIANNWVWASTPDDVTTAVDAFSGSSVVGYMYKSKGLGVGPPVFTAQTPPAQLQRIPWYLGR
jgi:hypothetical protein